MTDRRDTAIELAEKHGFAVFTLAYKTKVPHKGSHGFKDATRDRVKIEAMFAEHPDSNIAVAGGAVSGNIGIIDLDLDENGAYDGREELSDWQAEHGRFPETACVVTGRGGSQLFWSEKIEKALNTFLSERTSDLPPSLYRSCMREKR